MNQQKMTNDDQIRKIRKYMRSVLSGHNRCILSTALLSKFNY